MKICKFLLAVLVVSTNALASTKTVELVVPYAAGGTADKFAQIVLPALKTELAKDGMLPVISYRPGGGSVTGITSVVKNDQLQLLITSNSVITAPILNRLTNSYNVSEDLEVMAYLGHISLVMVTSSASDISSFADVASRCRTGKFNYGSGGPGTASHLGSAMVFNRLKCDIVHIPYKGMAPMVTAILGNHNAVGSDFVSGVKGLIDENKLRPLLVLDRTRLDSLPGVPSLADVGLLEARVENWFVIMSNRTANAQQQAQVQRAVTAVVATPEVVQQLRNLGLREIGAKKPTTFLGDEQRNIERILKTVKIDEQ